MFDTIFQSCVKYGTYPRCWKKAKVIAIAKPGKTNAADQKTYRPIGLLSVIDKVLDNFIISRIEPRIARNGGVYGFTKGKSTVDAIEEVINTSKGTMEVLHGDIPRYPKGVRQRVVAGSSERAREARGPG